MKTFKYTLLFLVFSVMPTLSWALSELTIPTSAGSTLNGGNIYKVTSDVTITATAAGQNALVVADNATVTIYIEKNCTLTVKGGDASGKTGAGAGIYVPATSKLYITGEGSLVATGGNGTYGSKGSNGGSADNYADSRPGQGGAGGNGGGGAGAGIGGKGGNGGNGGNEVGTKGGNVHWTVKRNGSDGNTGGNGGNGANMGEVYVIGTVSVTAKGGTASTYRESAASGGANYNDAATFDDGINPKGYYRLASGGGGAGGNGGNGSQAVAIGGGGYGAAGAGSGGAGGKDNTKDDASYENWWNARSCHGGDGKGGVGSTNGYDGTGSTRDVGTVYANYGSGSNSYWPYKGGAGGASGAKGSVGGDGTLYKMASASITQQTASRSVTSLDTPPSDIEVTITLVADESSSFKAYYGVAMQNVTVPDHSGYVFKGYYKSDGVTQVFDGNGAANGISLFTENTTLYAVWDMSVSVSESGYVTVFSDKNTIVPANVKVYGFTYSDGALIQGSEIGANAILPAGYGYLVKAGKGTYNFTTTTAAATVSESVLTGTTTEISTPAGDVYVWSKPEGYGYGFYKYTGATIPAGRAYYVKQ